MELHDPYRAPAVAPARPPVLPATPAPTPTPLASQAASTAAVYYSPPTMKIVALSLSTLGVYPMYWFWRNWRAIKRERGGEQWPWARALFSPIWAYFCFRELQAVAENRRRILAFTPGMLTVFYILLCLVGQVRGGVGLLSVLAFMPLLPINSLLRRYHQDERVDMQQMDRFGGWHILLLIVGGSVLLLALVFGVMLAGRRF